MRPAKKNSVSRSGADGGDGCCGHPLPAPPPPPPLLPPPPPPPPPPTPPPWPFPGRRCGDQSETRRSVSHVGTSVVCGGNGTTTSLPAWKQFWQRWRLRGSAQPVSPGPERRSAIPLCASCSHLHMVERRSRSMAYVGTAWLQEHGLSMGPTALSVGSKWPGPADPPAPLPRRRRRVDLLVELRVAAAAQLLVWEEVGRAALRQQQHLDGQTQQKRRL